RLLFSRHCSTLPRVLLPFPTRRSSDLTVTLLSEVKDTRSFLVTPGRSRISPRTRVRFCRRTSMSPLGPIGDLAANCEPRRSRGCGSDDISLLTLHATCLVDLLLGVLTKYTSSGVSRGPVAPRTFRDPPRTRKKICWQPFRPGFQTGEHEPQHREVASVVDI